MYQNRKNFFYFYKCIPNAAITHADKRHSTSLSSQDIVSIRVKFAEPEPAGLDTRTGNVFLFFSSIARNFEHTMTHC